MKVFIILSLLFSCQVKAPEEKPEINLPKSESLYISAFSPVLDSKLDSILTTLGEIKGWDSSNIYLLFTKESDLEVLKVYVTKGSTENLSDRMSFEESFKGTCLIGEYAIHVQSELPRIHEFVNIDELIEYKPNINRFPSPPKETGRIRFYQFEINRSKWSFSISK